MKNIQFPQKKKELVSQVYIASDLIMVRCPGCTDNSITENPDDLDRRNYAIPKSHLENIVTRYLWVKSLLQKDWLSKEAVLEFVRLADQLCPEMKVCMPD